MAETKLIQILQLNPYFDTLYVWSQVLCKVLLNFVVWSGQQQITQPSVEEENIWMLQSVIKKLMLDYICLLILLD